MKEGQGLLLEINYADGGNHNKPRTFLIVKITEKEIQMLNVSSIKGKERKLGFRSNKKIDKYKPPFLKPSFVKLDALYCIEKSKVLDNFMLCNGRLIHPLQLQSIKNDLKNYKNKFNTVVKKSMIEDILRINSPSLDESAMGEEHLNDK